MGAQGMSYDYMKFFRDRYEASKTAPDKERTRQMELAWLEYMNSRLVVLIDRKDYARFGDPFACHPVQPFLLAGIMVEEMDDGKSAKEAFDDYFSTPASEDLIWRAMKPEERLKPGELLVLMSAESRDQAMGLFGAGRVVKQILADDGIGLLSTENKTRESKTL